MKGRNTIGMNQLTLIAAVQMYLDSERKPDAASIEVTSVKVDCNNGGCLHVLVEINSREP